MQLLKKKIVGLEKARATEIRTTGNLQPPK